MWHPDLHEEHQDRDPALDNYTYYLNREGGILERYLDFNNPQGNSPVAVTNTNRGSTTQPDVEDIKACIREVLSMDLSELDDISSDDEM